MSADARLGRFELLGEIGSGAMGTVHRVSDPELGQELALKVLALPLAAVSEARRTELLPRFAREARLAGALEHLGIARVLDTGQAEGVPWISMQLIRGADLRCHLERLSGRSDSLRQGVSLVAEVAEAIEAAHRQGVIHRDLKPDNILVEEETGCAVVTEFGLAREVCSASRLTGDGQVLGTPQYLAPEQARGDPDEVDEQTDVYGLGATLYEVLADRPPYQADAAWRVALQALRGELTPPRALNASLPAELDAICLRAMAHDKRVRYSSADELASALRDWLAGRPPASSALQPLPERDVPANLPAPTSSFVGRGEELDALLRLLGGGAARELGDLRTLSFVAGHRGTTFLELGKPAAAREILEEALHICERLDMRRSVQYFSRLEALARAEHALGDVARARGTRAGGSSSGGGPGPHRPRCGAQRRAAREARCLARADRAAGLTRLAVSARGPRRVHQGVLVKKRVVVGVSK